MPMVMSMSDHSRPAPCPLCRKPATSAFRPFCSRGCKDRDLLNWLGGKYALPATAPVDEDDNPVLDKSDDDSL
jgi:hypothetical protein